MNAECRCARIGIIHNNSRGITKVSLSEVHPNVQSFHLPPTKGGLVAIVPVRVVVQVIVVVLSDRSNVVGTLKAELELGIFVVDRRLKILNEAPESSVQDSHLLLDVLAVPIREFLESVGFGVLAGEFLPVGTVVEDVEVHGDGDDLGVPVDAGAIGIFC